ncbi:E3 ubiquitin-protein ligase RBBP6-like isoform X2 [Gouania willdenowi]|nr:E3 ubiquitin-protein ligase RBBP6-like isoform X2 [Gouania willdenowi]
MESFKPTDSCPLSFHQGIKPPTQEIIQVRASLRKRFMMTTGQSTKKVMLTKTAKPAINAEAYAKGKKKSPPFVPHKQSLAEEGADPIPDNLLCPICTELMIDAVLIPCCGNSYCDECIRTALLDSEDHVCFTCKQSNVSPDNLIANKFLRQAVNNFNNGTTYTGAQVHHPALPPVYPPPALYGPPPQPYLPPYTSGPGLIPPPIISYQPQPVYASGHPVFNAPWWAPGSQPPLVHLPPPLPQPSISKDNFYKPRHHQMEKVTSKLDEVPKGFHKDGRSYPRSPISRHNGRSDERSRTRSRSHSRSYADRRSGCPQSPSSYRKPYRSRSRSRSPVGYRSRTKSVKPSKRKSEDAPNSRTMGEENRTSRGPPPGKLRRVDGPGMESEANSHSQAPHHPHFHRVPPSDRPGNPPLPGSQELNRCDPHHIPIEALMNIEVKPPRRIKLNSSGRKRQH